MVDHGNVNQSNNQSEASTLIEKLVRVNRVTKVVKGGRRFAFSAVVVVGDGRGSVGYGSGKAKEVTSAVTKATNNAKKSMTKIPMLEGRTLHHDIKCKVGSSVVIIRSAPPGTGVIAGGAMRSVFEALGAQDIVSKSLGSSNPGNLVRCTIEALTRSVSPKHIAAKLNKKNSYINAKRSTLALSNTSVSESSQSTAS